MRKDQGFDMLENADDRTIERLSDGPVLTAKEKERILKMSKEKLRRRYDNEMFDGEVSGVEKYRRPKWYSFAAVAASFVLVCGIIGTGVLINRNGAAPDPEKPELAKSTSVTTTMTVATGTGTNSTAKADTKTTAANNSDSTETTVASNETDLSATLLALFEQNERLSEICCGKDVVVDTSDSIYYNFDGIDYVYYRVVDDRFSSVEEAAAYFKQTVTGTIWRENYYKCFHDNFSPAIFRESDGKLYFMYENAESHHIPMGDFGEPQISNVTDEGFDFSLPAVSGGLKTLLVGNAVFENGRWKLDFYQHESASGGDNSNQSPSSDSSGNDTQNTGDDFISKCRAEAQVVWNMTVESNGSASIEYTFYDMDGDGTREFLLKHGTCEADFAINIYKYNDGFLSLVETANGGHTAFAHDTSNGQLVLSWGHMGVGGYMWYKLDGMTVSVTREENVDYSIIGAENVKGFENVEGLDTYGAYTTVDGSIESFASVGGGYQTVPGLDFSFMK